MRVATLYSAMMIVTAIAFTSVESDPKQKIGYAGSVIALMVASAVWPFTLLVLVDGLSRDTKEGRGDDI